MTVFPGEFDPDNPTRRPSDSDPPSRIGPEIPPASEDVARVLEESRARTLFAVGIQQLAKPYSIAVMRVLWPDLVLHEGWVFLAEGFSTKALQVWKESDHFTKTGMRGVAAAMNNRD